MVVIPATDKVLKIEAFTVTEVVADAEPPVPMQVSVYVTLPGAVGATVAEPVRGSLPENEPPVLVEVDALQEVALVEVHVSFTVRPKFKVVDWVGAVNDTVGMAGGGGGGRGDEAMRRNSDTSEPASCEKGAKGEMNVCLCCDM